MIQLLRSWRAPTKLAIELATWRKPPSAPIRITIQRTACSVTFPGISPGFLGSLMVVADEEGGMGLAAVVTASTAGGVGLEVRSAPSLGPGDGLGSWAVAIAFAVVADSDSVVKSKILLVPAVAASHS